MKIHYCTSERVTSAFVESFRVSVSGADPEISLTVAVINFDKKHRKNFKLKN